MQGIILVYGSILCFMVSIGRAQQQASRRPLLTPVSTQQALYSSACSFQSCSMLTELPQ